MGSFCIKEGLLFTSFGFIVLLMDTTIPLLQNIFLVGGAMDFHKDCSDNSVSIFFVDISIALFLPGKSSYSVNFHFQTQLLFHSHYFQKPEN